MLAAGTTSLDAGTPRVGIGLQPPEPCAVVMGQIPPWADTLELRLTILLRRWSPQVEGRTRSGLRDCEGRAWGNSLGNAHRSLPVARARMTAGASTRPANEPISSSLRTLTQSL